MDALPVEIVLLIFEWLDHAELLATVSRVCTHWKSWVESIRVSADTVFARIRANTVISEPWWDVDSMESYLLHSEFSWLQKGALMALLLRHVRQLTTSLDTRSYPCIDWPPEARTVKKIIAIPDNTYTRRFVVLHTSSSFPIHDDLFVPLDLVFSDSHLLVYADGYRQYRSVRITNFAIAYFYYLWARQTQDDFEASDRFLKLEKIIPMDHASPDRRAGRDYCAKAPAFIYSSARKRDRKIADSYTALPKELTMMQWITKMITCTHDYVPLRQTTTVEPPSPTWMIPASFVGTPLSALEYYVYIEEKVIEGEMFELELSGRISALKESVLTERIIALTD